MCLCHQMVYEVTVMSVFGKCPVCNLCGTYGRPLAVMSVALPVF